MPLSAKKTDALLSLSALEPLDALTPKEKRELARLRQGGGSQTRKPIAAVRALPALLAAGAPAVAPSGELKRKVLAAIEDLPRSSLAPARDVGFFLAAAERGAWQDHPVPGVRRRVLTVNRESNYAITLYELKPGVTFPEHPHAEAEECYVLSGDLHVDGRILRAGDFHHARKGTEHGIAVTESGCTLLIVAAA